MQVSTDIQTLIMNMQNNKDILEVMIMSKKYIKFFDDNFDNYSSWSDLVNALVTKFNISAEYADKLIDKYISCDY